MICQLTLLLTLTGFLHFIVFHTPQGQHRIFWNCNAWLSKKYFSQSSLKANPSATMWLLDYYGEIEVPLWVLNLVNKKIKNELRRKLEDYFSRVWEETNRKRTTPIRAGTLKIPAADWTSRENQAWTTEKQWNPRVSKKHARSSFREYLKKR